MASLDLSPVIKRMKETHPDFVPDEIFSFHLLTDLASFGQNALAYSKDKENKKLEDLAVSDFERVIEDFSLYLSSFFPSFSVDTLEKEKEYQDLRSNLWTALEDTTIFLGDRKRMDLFVEGLRLLLTVGVQYAFIREEFFTN